MQDGKKKYNFKKIDYSLIIIIILLGIISVVAIGSATRVYSVDGTDIYVNKQIFGYIIGFVIMLLFAFFDYHWLGKLAVPIYIFNIILLGLVLFVGSSTNDAVRWIMIGPVRFQPSEFAKVFMVLVLAKYFDKYATKINKLYIIIGSLILVIIPTLLIREQPDLSTSLTMAIIFVFMIFVAGISYWYIFGIAAIAVPIVTYGFWFIQQPFQTILKDYQRDRILSLINPELVDSSLLWQTTNSIQAVGSGRLFGKGLYLGKVNQYDYIPEPQTDFIFSVIGEEFGFLGCSIVILLLFLLILRCILIAKETKDLLGKLIIVGTIAIITYQTYINIGVVTGIVPNTGVTLPFISSGISSLLANLISIGIILNISMQRQTNN